MNKSTRFQNEDVVVLNDVFRRTDSRKFTSINAQLHSMESYINPDVDAALGFKPRHSEMVGEYSSAFPRTMEEGNKDDNSAVGSALGVALIQPVTTGIEYTELSRDLFPTKRSLSVNIEPVSVGISFEDLQLIETVTKRWSKKKVSGTEDVYAIDSVDEDFEKFEPDVELYNVYFYTSRLGLGLKADIKGITVIDNRHSEHSQVIKIGDILTGIEGQDFKGRSLDDVVGHLSNCKRPVRVTFERTKVLVDEAPSNTADENESHGSIDEISSESRSTDMNDTQYVASCYDIKFRIGMSRGLELEKSPCGRFPVVTRILSSFANATCGCDVDESNAEQIETTFDPPKNIRVPCTGAVVVAINGVSVEEIGVEETFQRLSALALEGNERNTYSSISEILESSQIYSLSFMEADADVWGKVDEIDISTTGIALSFIDDLNGRDMPLFRAELSNLKIHAERGMGIQARILDVNVPSLLKPFTFKELSKTDWICLPQNKVEYFQSESIITLCGLSMCAIDYFHPRIACWEPLVEPSRLFFLLEKQKGIQRRPGQIALELSDYVLHDQIFRNIKPSDRASKMLTVNVTDAATEVINKASSQWKKWRQSITDDSQDIGNDDISEELVREFKNISPSISTSEFNKDDMPIGQDNSNSHVNEQAQRYQELRRLAAQKTAHGALVFAQKRGAENSKKVESSKPFIFRNRTGVSIAFVQQRPHEIQRKGESLLKSQNMSVVGEYSGLEAYTTHSVTELADKEDAKFSMELMSGHESQLDSRQANNKVRDYEGRFPNLTVSIQAVSGVLVEPIVDLQVHKVGSEIRNLIVAKDVNVDDDQNDFVHYSIPVVWEVEIVDNRRILTLSTAVRVVSSGFSTNIEVGVQKDSLKSIMHTLEGKAPLIERIGVSRPENPFYLPLWLALKLDPIHVHVRPCSENGSDFLWSESSVMHFGPLMDEENKAGEAQELKGIGKWAWKETFSDLTFIQCQSAKEDLNPSQLSVFGSTSSTTKMKDSSKTTESVEGKQGVNEVISVTIDSGLTLRNMLPVNLEWEVAHSEGSSWRIVDGSSWRLIDGSSHHASERTDKAKRVFTFDYESISDKRNTLESGGCTEIFACHYGSQLLEARFKLPSGPDWSSWAPLSIFEDHPDRDELNEEEMNDGLSAMVPRARQVNVQVPDESFGAPLTFGVRIVPKLTIPDDPYDGRVYGLEVIIYAEVWIRNTTSLPLNFGCPSYQLHESVRTKDADGSLVSDESLARFTAESALMEIANLLEVGDKGTGLSNKVAKEVAESGVIESLPGQECDQLVEEVFEYIEIDSSTVKRRWWASESYDSYRENITKSSSSDRSWRWIDESWVSYQA